MYNGQFETLSVPLAGPALSELDVDPASFLEPQAARKDGPRMAAAAAAAPPPRNRLRLARLAPSRERSRGSIAPSCWEAMASMPFVRFAGGVGNQANSDVRSNQESSSISSRSSVVGMSAAGSTSEASGAQLKCT